MDREITAVKKDQKGTVVAYCNPGQSWSPRRLADVVKDIRHCQCSYYVKDRGRRTYVRVFAGGKLSTSKDAKDTNGLVGLPAC